MMNPKRRVFKLLIIKYWTEKYNIMEEEIQNAVRRCSLFEVEEHYVPLENSPGRQILAEEV